MSWSIGEIRSLSLKAARGAGFEWGEAEEAAFAVWWLNGRFARGTDALAGYLLARDTTLHHAEVCPIRFGIAVMDGAMSTESLPKQIFAPLLVVPFLAEAGYSGRLVFEEGAIQFSTKGVTENREAAVADTVKVTFDPGIGPQAGDCTTRVPDDARAAVKILNRFAGRTYAPATEASRMSGAGAGVSDND